jgi:glycosyltransferase involved in cell wall biosynthesis
MIEAMACGTPVLARNLGSVEEVIEAGVTGYYAPEIEGMIERLPATLGLDRRRVRERAEGRFAYARMVDGYLELYGSLVNH